MKYKKYNILTKEKPFSYKIKISFLLLDKEEVYEVLKEEAAEIMISEGQPSAIFERVVKEILDLKYWYLPDEFKIWNRRFGDLFKTKYFCYDDDVKSWSQVLHRYFVKLDYIPKRENYKTTRQFNDAWGYFAEILAVIKANDHHEFDKYYNLAIEKGMNKAVFERKCDELLKIKDKFI
ncbi:hypothetical protein [Gemelliphila palaticanis]|uniref:Uncharacterized protein n=1 Tax=Gemelliphila palaticanis TaxID=81950 RepID=A0ABX2T2D7_9BACL|nr:hypothetical protein [Gemella palaticanis]MBF0715694.1 hypothetical protein [Gemella palaticanis]NYS47624.1 hypothetical protein [Gemella palaticanis]